MARTEDAALDAPRIMDQTVRIGGAHIGNLTAFAPYQSIFIAITLRFLLIFCP